MHIPPTTPPNINVLHVESVYWTEPKATCRPKKYQPNAYNMYIDWSKSVCLYTFMSASLPGVVCFCRYVHIEYIHIQYASWKLSPLWNSSLKIWPGKDYLTENQKNCSTSAPDTYKHMTKISEHYDF